MKNILNESNFLELFCYQNLKQKIQTPFYVYQGDVILEKIESLKASLETAILQKLLIRYAMKANSNQSVLKLIYKDGCGMEVVSGGELWRCLQANIDPRHIIFSGVGKTEEEICLAIDQKIEQISVESLEELKFIANLSKPVNICIRICPEIAANTHDKITTGRLQDKFGLPLSQIPEVLEILRNSPHLNFLGFSAHIGSQIQDVQAYRQTFKVLAKLLKEWPKDFKVKRLDVGGGFFSPYYPDQSSFNWVEYANAINEELKGFEGELVIEPGRFLVAQAGVLFTRILYIKKTPTKTFVIVDAGMNDMMRTALYETQHYIVSCQHSQKETQQVDLVGPVCESSDFFGKNISLPVDLKVGDDLAITCTGAYGTSLSSMYNSRPLIPEILIEKGCSYLVREAITVQHLLEFETHKVIK